ncbi:SDR family oxidoreductase [Massilia sp. Dwa41.01b]|uniref:SDR family oxidoreductase n=1 Tax=unclassified Massilia TaxID=2609279 RepID=UPI001601C3B1|nr:MULTISPECIES: SDR family oxidoreductase [unclassified Massilia]QNA87290.1 SDR family oxidoreductase [Massilia sp. Dwa41.01b]QNA98195.1 SDR family oxidoreductase [Massilia sp. Se16.2.3]
MSNGKAAIVTGASRGIGRAIALRLAHDGFAVAVNYASRREDAEEVVDMIAARGGRAVAIQADVASSADAARLFDEAQAAFGEIDVVINNAGVIQPGTTLLADTDDALYERIFSINTRGTFHMLRLAATRLRHGGRIVNFSTSVIGLAMPGYAVYAGAKAAVETFTNIFAKEMRGKGISVMAVAPGPTATELFLDGKPAELVERLAKAAPLERLGTPEDIANTVSFLVGPEGEWVNGQTLRVNGGIV